MSVNKTLDQVGFTVIKNDNHLIRWSNGFYFIDFYLKEQTYYTEDKRPELIPIIKEECRRYGFKQFKEEAI